MKHRCYGTQMTSGWRCRVCEKQYNDCRIIESWELKNYLVDEKEASKTQFINQLKEEYD